MKQKTYSGYGVNKMLSVCFKNKLTDLNSDLWVKDPSDLNSYWKVTLK